MSGPGQNHGGAVSERLMQAMNAHDLDAEVACFRDDYRSEQPAHPARTFTGREQVRQTGRNYLRASRTSEPNCSASLSLATKSGPSGFGMGPRTTGRPSMSAG